jgi:hypothetical protein
VTVICDTPACAATSLIVGPAPRRLILSLTRAASPSEGGLQQRRRAIVMHGFTWSKLASVRKREREMGL